MAKYECKICSYIYNEQQAGRPFSELDRCPICEEGKENFTMIEPDPEPVAAPVQEVSNNNAWEDKNEENTSDAVASDEQANSDVTAVDEQADSDAVATVVEDTANEAEAKAAEAPEAKPFNTDYVVERRQEFWSPFSGKTEKKKEEPAASTKAWTIDNAFSSVERVLDLNGNVVNEMKADEVKEDSADNGFKPLWGTGTVQRVVDGNEEGNVVKDSVIETPVYETVEPEAPFYEEIKEEPVATAEFTSEADVAAEAVADEAEALDEGPVEDLFEEVRDIVEDTVEEPYMYKEIADDPVMPEFVIPEVISGTEEVFFEDTDEDEIVDDVVDVIDVVDAVTVEADEEADLFVAEEAVTEDEIVAEEAVTEDEDIAEEASVDDEYAEDVETEPFFIDLEEIEDDEIGEAEDADFVDESYETAEEREAVTEDVAEMPAEEESTEVPETVDFEEVSSEETVEEATEEATAEDDIAEAAEEVFEEEIEEVTEEIPAVNVDEAIEEAIAEETEEVEEESVAEETAEEAFEEMAEEAIEEEVEEIPEDAVEMLSFETEEEDAKAPVIRSWSFVDEVVADSEEKEEVKRYEYIADTTDTDADVAEDAVEEAIYDEPVIEVVPIVLDEEVTDITGEVKNYSNRLENIMILPAQLNPMPLAENTPIDTKIVIGMGAERPLILEQPVTKRNAHNVLEYIPNNGLTSEDFQQADAIEIVVGRGNGIEKTISSKEDLRQAVSFLRLEADGCPIGVKLAAGRIERDLEFCVFAKPDFVVLNDFSVVPLPYALYRANKYLNTVQPGMELIVEVDNIQDAEETAKIMAMGADVIILKESAKNVSELTEALKKIARETGHYDVQDINVQDLCTTDREIAEYTDICHV